MKRKYLFLGLAATLALSVGTLTGLSLTANAAEETGETEEPVATLASFAMAEGASVRLVDDGKSGIRFTALMNADTYKAVNADTAELGVVVLDYNTAATSVLETYMSANMNPEGLKTEAGVTHVRIGKMDKSTLFAVKADKGYKIGDYALTDTDNYYGVNAVLYNVKGDRTSTQLMAVAYYYDGENYTYSDLASENGRVRSLTQVAKAFATDPANAEEAEYLALANQYISACTHFNQGSLYTSCSGCGKQFMPEGIVLATSDGFELDGTETELSLASGLELLSSGGKYLGLSQSKLVIENLELNGYLSTGGTIRNDRCLKITPTFNGMLRIYYTASAANSDRVCAIYDSTLNNTLASQVNNGEGAVISCAVTANTTYYFGSPKGGINLYAAMLVPCTEETAKLTQTLPTCEQDGSNSYEFFGTSVTVVEKVDKLGHSWDDGVVTTEPTCEKEGVKTFTCNRCGATDTQTVDKVPHNYGEDDNCTMCGASKFVKYTLSWTPAANGKIVINNAGDTSSEGLESGGQYVSGTQFTLKVTADDGYEIGSVTENDNDITSKLQNGEYTFALNGNTSFTVTYVAKAKPYVAIFQKGSTSLATDVGFTASRTDGKDPGYKTKSQTFTYNGTTYNSPLKIEKATVVSFTLETKSKLTIYLYESGNATCNVDGNKETATNCLIEITLEKGEHKITRADGEAWLCYVVVEPIM